MWQPEAVTVAEEVAVDVAVEDGEDVGDAVAVVVAVADTVADAVVDCVAVAVAVAVDVADVVYLKHWSNCSGHVLVVALANAPQYLVSLCWHGPEVGSRQLRHWKTGLGVVVFVAVVVVVVGRTPLTQGTNPSVHWPSLP